MKNNTHRLFKEFPLTGETDISTGRVSTPYQTYDGHGVFIGGSANLENITTLLENENLYPIQTTEGRALMGVWAVDFIEANLGPHTELQFSILVSHEPARPIENHPFSLLKALFSNPQARMFCYGLWNNTETVVAYNRELLGLNAKLSEATIMRKNGLKTFRFQDKSGNEIFSGGVSEEKRPSPQVGLALLRLLGFRHKP